MTRPSSEHTIKNLPRTLITSKGISVFPRETGRTLTGRLHPFPVSLPHTPRLGVVWAHLPGELLDLETSPQGLLPGKPTPRRGVEIWVYILHT